MSLILNPESTSLRIHLAEHPPVAGVLTRETIGEAMDQLTLIAHMYRKYDDPLSRKLQLWCMKFLRKFDENQKPDSEYFVDVAARIHKLTHGILFNPVDSAHGEHEFAKEMLAWRDSLPIEKLNPAQARLHELKTLQKQMNKEFAFFNFPGLWEQAQNNLAKIKETIECRRLIEQIKNDIAQTKEELQQQAVLIKRLQVSQQ